MECSVGEGLPPARGRTVQKHTLQLWTQGRQLGQNLQTTEVRRTGEEIHRAGTDIEITGTDIENGKEMERAGKDI